MGIAREIFMFILQTEIYYIILNFLWLISILLYLILSKKMKLIIVGLIPINGLESFIISIFLLQGSNKSLAEFFIMYFVILTILLISFVAINRKYITTISILENMDEQELKLLVRYTSGVSFACLLILGYELLNIKSGLQIIYEYLVFISLVIINIIVHFLLSKKYLSMLDEKHR